MELKSAYLLDPTENKPRLHQTSLSSSNIAMREV